MSIDLRRESRASLRRSGLRRSCAARASRRQPVERLGDEAYVTFILSLATRNGVYQVADRRLTWLDGAGRGAAADHDANRWFSRVGA